MPSPRILSRSIEIWHEDLGNNYFALLALEGTAEGSRIEYPHILSDSGTKRIFNNVLTWRFTF
jgi:hypothetical protein